MGMKVGGKRQLFVPAHLAYGDRSMGAHIKPGADLTFEIELLEVLTRDD
ncbi:Peptidyl-prolyl cis-trans isomerase [Pseudomonas syringae pv. lapsa]|nr:Peptidyl-prolyl cis-trans isomerase [Pseudomonas syringae pv. lapsa]RML15073.1 Peptidyl-prolyl cis-trans isomerase [Pseudomonas syringae pv. lapsa]RML26241.1 Peptidyl-prolyl cis-trans isomerase [Pseudomonas syringae pv. lapsa]SFO18840.1 peptidylprolyl isomerase [Pseudomonas syringae]